MPALLAQVTEATLQRQITAEARSWGWRVFHDVVAWRSDAGWPDLVMVRGDRVVVAELKNGRNMNTGVPNGGSCVCHDTA